MCWSRQKCPQSQLGWLMRSPVSKSLHVLLCLWSTASGQCEQASYAFCRGVGTPCGRLMPTTGTTTVWEQGPSVDLIVLMVDAAVTWKAGFYWLLSNVNAPSTQSLVYGESLAFSCADDFTLLNRSVSLNTASVICGACLFGSNLLGSATHPY